MAQVDEEVRPFHFKLRVGVAEDGVKMNVQTLLPMMMIPMTMTGMLDRHAVVKGGTIKLV